MVIADLQAQSFPEFYKVFSDLMHEGYAGFPKRLQDHFLRYDYSASAMQNWLELGLRKFLIAFDDDGISGFLVGDNSYGGVAFVSWIGVAREKRNAGVGSSLLEAYEQFAKSRAAHLIELFTFDTVKPFYIARGYKEAGRRESGYYGRQNVIMNKTIGSWSEKNLPALT
ncbi:MAG: Acetyltransferase (GNAT) family protein [candidate division WS6 bacterium OLB20]|uniref:Acetyltransferase (GNAT) family protein n=1 Tax=candidate division WS6 bacterium OLB20 TaxID=1617426 RepID=A0A136LW40_9BACT|nr:MAG: Acetyltransferase (GNAT) family protein [candidate division WS6 bacterium OLB20]